MATAVGEVFKAPRALAAGEHQRQRLIGVLGVQELPDGLREELIGPVAQHLLPRRIHQSEAPRHRDRGQQVAGHLKQAGHAGLAVGGPCSGRAQGLAPRRGLHRCPSLRPSGPPCPGEGTAVDGLTMRRGSLRRPRPGCGGSGAFQDGRPPSGAGASAPAAPPTAGLSARPASSPRRNLHTERHIMIVMNTALVAHSSQTACIENSSR